MKPRIFRLAALALALTACAAGTHDADKAANGGLVSQLVLGFWHGIIAPITLLVEVVRPFLPGIVPWDVHMFETGKVSVPYDVGFYFGISSGPPFLWSRRGRYTGDRTAFASPTPAAEACGRRLAAAPLPAFAVPEGTTAGTAAQARGRGLDRVLQGPARLGLRRPPFDPPGRTLNVMAAGGPGQPSRRVRLEVFRIGATDPTPVWQSDFVNVAIAARPPAARPSGRAGRPPGP